MALSVMVALILTPALCATLLKPLRKGEHYSTNAFFTWFNRNYDRGSSAYRDRVRNMLGRTGRYMAVFVLLVGLMVVLFQRLPSAFLPDEDQGTLMTQILAPVGSTQERTMKSIEKVEDYFLNNEADAVKGLFSVQGFSFGGVGQNNGMAWVNLKDWSERKAASLHADAVARRARMALSQIKDALAFAFVMPAMPELGVSAGFSFFLQDNAGRGHEALMAARNQFLGAAARSKLLTNVRPNGQEDTPQFHIDIDRSRATALGLSLADINSTLSAAWGSQYIDDFIDQGRVKHVYVEADAPFRMSPGDFDIWSVRNSQGQMVPFRAFAGTRWDYGSPRLERFNGVPSVEIAGQGAPGVSTGTAMAEVQRLVSQLPAGFGVEWTGVSYQERQAGTQLPLLYTLSLLVIFLCLAALYESWSIPTAVLMVAPLGILGAALATLLRGMERDIYFQVAMLTTVGLTSKNAILIIEFAKTNLEHGKSLVEATMEAVRVRLRPILMTSLAFGFGVLPLAIASGAGSGAQRAIGTGVLGGMLAGVSMGIFFIPMFFTVVERLILRKEDRDQAAGNP
jgi:multidrug efflux pump